MANALFDFRDGGWLKQILHLDDPPFVVGLILPDRMKLTRRFAPLAIVLLTSCRGESSPARGDSAVGHTVGSAATEPRNSYASIAGDTLQLVSVGGTALTAASAAPLPCDAAHTTLRQQIIIAADSTYWETTIARPGCRDTAKASSDTVESRGSYHLFGDTLVLSPANIDEDTSFAGLLFADSVVEVDVPSAQALRYARHQGTPGDPAQMGRAHTDSVFVIGDIDGSGKPDYVVRETRMGSISDMKDYRVAVYLDKDPGTGRPDWANKWDALDIGASQGADTSLSIGHDATMLAIGWSGGDYSATDILIAEHGKVRPEISHGIDYGHGYFAIKREAGTVVVEANLDHLELRGAPVTAAIKCTEPEMAVIRLVYDLKTRHFLTERSRCARPM